MLIVGIDYSMTSPCVAVHVGSDAFSIDNMKFHFLAQTKKQEGYCGMINSHIYPQNYKNDEERFDMISDWVIDIIENANTTNEDVYVYIEGYSMGSKGRVFHIAENTGLLKHKLFKCDFIYDVIAPTRIKKFASGKGNANKQKMEDAFIEETGYDIKQILHMTEKQWNPSSDIIDAYYICKYGFYENSEQNQ